MKMLILGFDSLGDFALQNLKLHKLKEIINSGYKCTPRIDNNVSRGWPEIYTGKTAYDTGGFYWLPLKMKNRIHIETRTGLSFIRRIVSEDVFLWHKLNTLNYKVGLVNVNTIDTTFSFNGFLILGSSSGSLNPLITKSNIYPQSIYSLINEVGNFDISIRMGYGAYIPRNLNEFENYCMDHIYRFFKLLRLFLEREKPDVYFVHSPVIGELMFKFANLFVKNPISIFEKKLYKVIMKISKYLDEQVSEFIEFSDPQHLLIVSDHGSGPLEYHVDLNAILMEVDLIKPKKFKSLIKNVKRKLYNIAFRKNYPLSREYDLEQSYCFSVGYTDCLYINDYRFLGKANTDFKYKVCDLLNDFSREKKLTIRFEPIEKPNLLRDFLPLPDIRVKMPNTYFNSGRTARKILSRVAMNFSEDIFIKGFPGEYQGWRAEDTIFAYIGPYYKNVEIKNLTDIYLFVLKVLGGY